MFKLRLSQDLTLFLFLYFDQKPDLKIVIIRPSL